MLLPKVIPWDPPDYDDDIIYAIRAVSEGVASDRQQKIFWQYLMHVTGFHDIPFRPDPVQSTFAAGKFFVGKMFDRLRDPLLTPSGQQAKGASVARRQAITSRKRQRKN